MGDISPEDTEKELLLVTLPGLPPQQASIDEIHRRFPDVEVKWLVGAPHGLKAPEAEEGKKERLEFYKKATYIVTLGLAPESEEEVPHLKLLHIFSAGIDHLLTRPIYTTLTTPLTTSSGIHGPPIAEWVLSALLALSRRTFEIRSWQTQHQWGDPDRSKSLTSVGDWVGKTVGIAGYGSIGRQVARLLTGLGCKVHAYTARARKSDSERRDGGWIVGEDQNDGRGLGLGDREGRLPVAWFSEEDGAGGEGDKKTGLHTFLRSGLSAIVVALPLTPATTGLFGRAEFEMLRDGVQEATRNARPKKPQAEIDAAGCYFVNIARGKMVDQDALIEALNDGTLKGAALDVTDPEPLPKESKLWDAKNCFVSPHISGLGREYAGRSLEIVMENIGRLKEGGGSVEEGGLVNEVRRGRGY